MLCPVCQSPNLDDAHFCASCGTPLEPVEVQLSTDSQALEPRTALRGGAFVIEELLGAGGFGLTYHARESALSREVAVKEFFPFGSTRQNGRVVPPVGVSEERWKTDLGAFREEALTLARFSHPAIVRAYAVWAENGTAYFAMEFLRGQSLQKRLDAGKPIAVDEALQIIEHVGEALARVHETGLLHRDIKPDNILLCPGRAVLIDFGTARTFAADKTTPMTQLLTPGYAPLEQYGRRARFGPFTDVYALAATLYHALSGQAPPSAPDRAAGVELRPLDELNPRVSPALARAVESALEIAVPKRPPTVVAWLEHLREAVAPPPPVPAPVEVAPSIIPPLPHEGTAPTGATTGTPHAPGPPTSYPQPQSQAQPLPVGAPDSVYPLAPELPPEARAPKWFWPAVIGVPLFFVAIWLLRDPARGDLGAFDRQLRPILRLSDGVQKSYAALGSADEQTFQATIRTQVLPNQQRVVTALSRLAPSSDEALFSRDQLLDAEEERLAALQEIANDGNQNAALQSLLHAERAKTIWSNDYRFLLHQHRLG